MNTVVFTDSELCLQVSLTVFFPFLLPSNSCLLSCVAIYHFTYLTSDPGPAPQPTDAGPGLAVIGLGSVCAGSQ